MRFFRLENFEFAIANDSIFLTKEFEELLKNYNPKDIFSICKYIYLRYDLVDSPYLDLNENEKQKEAMADSKVNIEWINDPVVLKCIEKFEELNHTFTMKVRDSTKENLHRLIKYATEADLNEKDKKGELIHDANKIAALVKQFPELTKQIRELSKQIDEELAAQGRARGGKSTSPIESGAFSKITEKLLIKEAEIKKKRTAKTE
jgi:hypothetical protein